VNFATDAYVRSALAMTRDELRARMRNTEMAQGFTIVADADWLDWDDWTQWTIISQDTKRARLVALEAKNPGNGAFTRLIDAIWRAGLVPVLVEPNQLLIDWCHRHQFRKRTIGNKNYRHDIWYPKRCAY
jgi:hypothetical protein